MNRFLIFALMLALSPMFLNAQTDETKPIRVIKAVAFAKSAPLSEIAAKLSPDKTESIIEEEVHNELDFDKWPNEDSKAPVSLNVQSKQGSKNGRGPLVGFNGQGFTGYYPPDTDGDVSDEHFVQMVNSKYNVYEKDGTKILGPLNLGNLWAQLPGAPWGNSGDPIVLWDENAERWVLTQFAPKTNTTNYELFAISVTSDPLGEYYLYAFEFGVQFNDYPKIGVWRDGYYATYNLFNKNNGSPSFIGSKITTVEREKMLVGDPNAQMIEFLKSGYYSTMPADIDGSNLPEEGAPCPVMYINNQKRVEMWSLHADWETTSNSTLTKQNPNIIVTTFSSTPNTNNTGNGFVSQPNTNRDLDGLGSMIMNRLAYRKFSDHEAMVTVHSIKAQPEAGGPYNRSGVRWYEFRRTATDDNWTLYQEGTYAPDDGIHRWMGSAAINADGDIAIAYSVSRESITGEEDIFPSIRFTGRHANDPLGEMTLAEVELKQGTSSQTSFSRWGDYSCINVDPADGKTFWYTTEYNGWKTWIASFDLEETAAPTCNAGEDAQIETNDQFITQGSGTAVAEIEWTTDGDGFFSPSNLFNSTYIRGSQDVANMGCNLILTVTGYDGETTATDEMHLTIGNVGIQEQKKADQLKVYPNPTNGMFTLNVNNLSAGEEFTFFVYTSYGKEIYRQVVTANSTNFQRVIDMTDFVAGVYMVTVNSNKGTSTLKIVKK